MTPECAIVHNLICFNICFSTIIKDVCYESPSYIMEIFRKYIIGDQKDFKFNIVDYDEIIDSMTESQKLIYDKHLDVWGEISGIKPIILYLILSDDLNLFNMSNHFERLICPLENINKQYTVGLNYTSIRELYSSVVVNNSKASVLIKKELRKNFTYRANQLMN